MKRAFVSPRDIERSDLLWLHKGGTPFIEIDDLDLPEREVNDLYALYANVYSDPKIGIKLKVKNKYGLLKYDRWVLIVKDSKLIGFAIFRTHAWGLKLGLIGSDGTPEGRTAVKAFIRKAFKVRGVFGEVSPPLEYVLKGHAPQVDVKKAKKVLDKDIDRNADGFHYYREVSNIGRKRKIIYGNPIAPNGT